MVKCHWGIHCPHPKCKYEHAATLGAPETGKSIAHRFALLYATEVCHVHYLTSTPPDDVETFLRKYGDHALRAAKCINISKRSQWYWERHAALSFLRLFRREASLSATLCTHFGDEVTPKNLKALRNAKNLDVTSFLKNTKVETVKEEKVPLTVESFVEDECTICADDLTGVVWVQWHSDNKKATWCSVKLCAACAETHASPCVLCRAPCEVMRVRTTWAFATKMSVGNTVKAALDAEMSLRGTPRCEYAA